MTFLVYKYDDDVKNGNMNVEEFRDEKHSFWAHRNVGLNFVLIWNPTVSMVLQQRKNIIILLTRSEQKNYVFWWVKHT